MLTFRILRGASWAIASRLGGRLIDFVTLLVLARILSPADFGLTAIGLSIIAIIDTILEIPIAQALTRLRALEKSHFDTAFTLGALRGLVVGLPVLIAAWPIAHPRLTALIIALAAAPIARSFYSPAMASFYRDLNFRVSFIADFLGKVLAALLSVGALYLGAGYWAIVINSVASSLIPTLFSYALAPYRPTFSLSRMADFSSFIGWFTSSQVVAAVSWQFDRIFLGYHVDKTSLGGYTIAGDFSVLPTQSLIGPAMRPVMAAFATFADDPVRLRQSFLKASRMTMFIAAPIGLGIALTADLVVNIVLGPKWLGTTEFLRWLSLSVILTAYFQPLYSLALALNRPIVIFQINVVDLAFKVLLVTAGYVIAGLEGVLVARVASSIILFAASVYYVRRLLEISVVAQLTNVSRIGFSCLLMLVGVLAARAALQSVGIPALNDLLLTSAFGALT